MLEQGVESMRGDEFVEFWEAGTEVQGAFQCAECGYGVSVPEKLPTCPMCAGTSWELSPANPVELV